MKRPQKHAATLSFTKSLSSLSKASSMSLSSQPSLGTIYSSNKENNY